MALPACHRAPAEQQITQAIDGAAAAARGNDSGGVLAIVADDFTGNAGALDRRGVQRLLAWRALRQDRTGVLVGPITFAARGDRIVATFNLVLTGGRRGSVLPADTTIYRMVTAWRGEGGRWICYSADWSRGSG